MSCRMMESRVSFLKYRIGDGNKEFIMQAITINGVRLREELLKKLQEILYIIIINAFYAKKLPGCIGGRTKRPDYDIIGATVFD